MDGVYLGILVDFAIPVVGGVVMLLITRRKIGQKPGENPKWDALLERWGKLMTILSVLCILGAVLIAIGKLARI